MYRDLCGSKKSCLYNVSFPTIVSLITLLLSKLKPAIISPQNCDTMD